jgi:hypothetical protein
MALTSEYEEQERRWFLSHYGVRAAALLLCIALLVFLRYAVHDRKYHQFTDTVREQINLQPYDVGYQEWLYLGTIDQQHSAPGGSYNLPTFAAAKNSNGEYLVAGMFIDAKFRHGNYPDIKKSECLTVVTVPEEAIQNLAKNDSKAARQFLANIPLCGSPSANVWYDQGGVNMERTAKTLLNK